MFENDDKFRNKLLLAARNLLQPKIVVCIIAVAGLLNVEPAIVLKVIDKADPGKKYRKNENVLEAVQELEYDASPKSKKRLAYQDPLPGSKKKKVEKKKKGPPQKHVSPTPSEKPSSKPRAAGDVDAFDLGSDESGDAVSVDAASVADETFVAEGSPASMTRSKRKERRESAASAGGDSATSAGGDSAASAACALSADQALAFLMPSQDDSSEIAQLTAENERLEDEVAELKKDNKVLKDENQQLAKYRDCMLELVVLKKEHKKEQKKKSKSKSASK